MIRGLAVKNWMCFKDQHFDFVGINLLYGRNNTGKSALLKHLLAYRQSRFLDRFIFSPNGEFVTLGDEKDILYRYNNILHFQSKIIFSNDTFLDQVYMCNKRANNFIAFRNNLHEVNQIYTLSSLLLTEPLFNERLHYVHSTAYHGHSVDDVNNIIDKLLRENKEYKIQNEVWSTERLFTFFDCRDASKSANAKFLCALLNVAPGDLLILEHPVDFMHPKMQSIFTHLMVTIANENVQLFVESHSDHLVNGMLIAVKQKFLKRKNVQLFFFETLYTHDEAYSVVLKPTFKKDGRLENCPLNLFKQFDDDMTALM